MNTAVLCVTELLKNSTGFITALFLLNRLFGYKLKIKKAALTATVILFAVVSMLPFYVMERIVAYADFCVYALHCIKNHSYEMHINVSCTIMF